VNLLFEIIFFPKKLLNVFPCLVELVKVKPSGEWQTIIILKKDLF